MNYIQGPSQGLLANFAFQYCHLLGLFITAKQVHDKKQTNRKTAQIMCNVTADEQTTNRHYQ